MLNRPLRSPMLLALGACCLMAPLATAQVDPQARRALENMAAVVSEAQTISYEVNVRGEGGFFGMLPPAQGKVKMMRRDEPLPSPTGSWRLRIEGKSDDAKDVPGTEFVVVSDGQRFSWIDHERRELIYRPHSAARGQPAASATTIQIPRLADTNLVERDLGAPTIELVEQVTLDGQVCDVILVDPGEMQLKTQWTIARDDGLPRRVEELLQGGGLNDRRIWTITNVRVNAELSESDFTLVAPEGYTTRGAPAAARPVTQTAPMMTDRDDEAMGDVPLEDGRERVRVVGTNVGDLAPDFELPAPGGETVRLSSLRGNVVVLDFWGTWCIPCRQSSPKVQKLHEDYKDKGVRVLGLAVRERDDENPINYMREREYTYGLLLRADDVAAQYRVRTYPTFFVIGREGEIVHIEARFDPATSFTAIRDAVDQALGAGSASTAPATGSGETAGDDGEASEGAR